MNCAVLRKGYLYGFSEKTLECINLADGTEQWKDKSMGKGSLMMSTDGRLILMSDDGELAVAQADPAAFKVLARSQVLPKGRCLTSPVPSTHLPLKAGAAKRLLTLVNPISVIRILNHI